MRIIPQRVPPSASAASFSPGGVCVNTSRVTAATIGSTISDTTMPAMNIDPVSSAPSSVRKIGIQPKCRLIHSDSGAISYWSTKNPQMPYSRLGMAASRSTRAVRRLRQRPEA